MPQYVRWMLFYSQASDAKGRWLVKAMGVHKYIHIQHTRMYIGALTIFNVELKR